MGTVIPWTAWQDKKLRELYGKKTNAEIAAVVGRNERSVKDRIVRLRSRGDKAFPILSDKQREKLALASKRETLEKPAPKPKPEPKTKPLTQKQTDAILHKATAPRPPTWEEAELELKEAIETCCHASANYPLTKQRCQMLLLAWNVLDMMEKV